MDTMTEPTETTEPTEPPPNGPIGHLTLDAIDYYNWVMQETSPYPGYPTMGNTHLAAALAGACFSAQFPEALAASRRLGLTPSAPSVHAVPPEMYVARTATPSAEVTERPPTDIYDAEAIAEQINRFLCSLINHVQPALAEALTLRYAEALLSWHHKLK